MKIVVIGSGNVAFHLIKAFTSTTDVMLFVHARNKASLDLLKLEFPSITQLSGYDLTAVEPDLVLLSVKDDALNAVFQQYTYPADTLVAHTSGMQTFVDTSYHQNLGVFYPLQTFSRSSLVDWSNTPVLIEGTSEKMLQILEKAANTIQAPYFETGVEQRKYIHAAAVLTSNFTNHLIGKAAVFLEGKSIDYHILQPLVEATIRKAFTKHPFDVQTGPAIRNDVSTMDMHETLLKEDVLLQKIYRDISESIRKTTNLDSE
jgi:predicted short-subunit dehydrogenase-like oxidoreductase (DUF2520 family)